MDPRLNSLTIGKLLRSLADLLMPRVCVVCGRQLLDSEKEICVRCMADFPLTYFWERSRNPMADRFNERLLGDGSSCYQYACALFHYGGGYDSITQALKYKRDFAVGRHFSRMLGDVLAGSECFADVDLVCCVPLHWARRFRRGYNQAEVIGKEVAARLGVRFEARLLRRTRHTRSQTKLDTAGKALNVQGAFAVNRRRLCCVRPGSHILIIDDVFTSGATLASCSRALREAFGPEVRISAATLAYAGT